MAVPMHVCDMPDEVIHTILAKLDDTRTVLRLAQTSRWFALRAVAQAAAGPLGCGGRGRIRQSSILCYDLLRAHTFGADRASKRRV
jgi:hypothetical protein